LKKFSLFFLLLCSFSLHAKVEIASFAKNAWTADWSDALYEEISLSDYQSLLTMPIDEGDLTELKCKGYNQTTDSEQRKDFWIVFLSSLARAESAFNPKVRSIAPKGGHGNYGLLQFSKRTAREKCQLDTLEKIFNPKDHLRCGLKLLSWQLHGAPTGNGHFLRRDLKHQLFGKYIFLWGPLRQNDKRGRALLTGWFNKHLDQLPFCSQT
jgi:hypothetical protein